MRFAIYCICGGMCRGNTDDKAAEFIQKTFWKAHDGEGHCATTAAVCARARRKAEQDEFKQG